MLYHWNKKMWNKTYISEKIKMRDNRDASLMYMKIIYFEDNITFQEGQTY